MRYGRVILVPDPSRIQGGANPDINYDATMGGVGGANGQTWEITVPQRATWMVVSGSAGGGGGGQGGPIGTPYGGGGGGSGQSVLGARFPVRGGIRLSCTVGFGGQTSILNDGGPGFATTIEWLDDMPIQGNAFMVDNSTQSRGSFIFRLEGGGGGQGAQPAAPGRGGYAACARMTAVAPGYAVEMIRDGGQVYGGATSRTFIQDYGVNGLLVCSGGDSGVPVGAVWPGMVGKGQTAELLNVTAGAQTFFDTVALAPFLINRHSRGWTSAAEYALYANGGHGGSNLFARGGTSGRGNTGFNQSRYARPPSGLGGGGGGGGGAAVGVNDTIAGGFGGNGILILDFED